MKNKNAWIAFLIVANVALAAGIFVMAQPAKPAFAQGTGLAGNYLAVAGEVQDSYDALYLIDMRSYVLHALVYDRGRRELEYAASRDLRRDFRNDRD